MKLDFLEFQTKNLILSKKYMAQVNTKRYNLEEETVLRLALPMVNPERIVK